jgi:hypothetical protein
LSEGAAANVRPQRQPRNQTLERLVRRLKQVEGFILRRPFYDGYELNRPRVGDVLVHTIGADGARHSLRIVPSGAVRRYVERRS